VNKGDGVVGKYIADEKAIWQLVVNYARATSLGKLAPHDLRRYAEFQNMPNRDSGALWKWRESWDTPSWDSASMRHSSVYLTAMEKAQYSP
jgi:hypothetical protein